MPRLCSLTDKARGTPRAIWMTVGAGDSHKPYLSRRQKTKDLREPEEAEQEREAGCAGVYVQGAWT